jgi:hypothetical protein
MKDARNTYSVLVGKPELKIPFRRPGSTWEYKIRTDLRETGTVDVDWMQVGLDRDQWRTLLKHGNEP